MVGAILHANVENFHSDPDLVNRGHKPFRKIPPNILKLVRNRIQYVIPHPDATALTTNCIDLTFSADRAL